MKRRAIIKGLGAMGLVALLPGGHLIGDNQQKKFHFIGLGFGGTNAARHIQQNGIVGDYSCFAWFPSIVTPIPFDPEPFEPYPFIPYEGFHHIDYTYPIEFRQSNELGRKRIPLTHAMKAVLSQDVFYIIIVGLGAFTGSSLITDVVEFLEARNVNYLAICTLPFKNEGRTRNNYALQRKMELQKYKHVLFFDNERICGKYKEAKISEKFALADEEIYRIFQKELPTLRS